MKKSFPWFLAIAALITSCSQDNSIGLNEADVQAFVTNHIEAQVGYEAALEPYKAGLSEETKVFVAGRNAVNNVSMESIDPNWFYEDSVRVEILDTRVYGSAASIMGKVHFYNFGMHSERSFHGTVVQEDGRLRWDRWFHAENGSLARNTMKFDSDVEGAKDLANQMIYRSLQGDFNGAGALSDSLILMDPKMAMAHSGSMWRAWASGDQEAWDSHIDQAVAKSANESAAMTYYFKSHSDRYGDRLENAIKAHMLASDSPLTQTNLAWVLMGSEDFESAQTILEQASERWSAIGGIYNMMGYLNMEQDKMEEAKTCFSMYLRLASDVANAHDSMGDFYRAQGQKDEAIACYQKALELDASFTASQRKIDELNNPAPEEGA